MAETEPQNESEAILDLSIDNPVPRKRVKIDDRHYEMCNDLDFSMDQMHQLTALGRTLDKLMGKDSLSDKERADLAGVADKIVKMVMHDLPDDVRAKLQDGHKMRIAQVFMNTAELFRGNLAAV